MMPVTAGKGPGDLLNLPDLTGLTAVQVQVWSSV